ncbi:MAG TPA: hypothetical protein VIU15_24830, partial [Streptomyces sp.]
VLVGCDPGGIGAVGVANTTGVVAKEELRRRGVAVRWLNCTGQYVSSSETPGVSVGGEVSHVSVDCDGTTEDGQDVTLTGRVTRAVEGACVRGDLSADVGERQVFRVSGLGECASPTPVVSPSVGGG